MNKRQEKKLRDAIGIIIKDRDLDLCARLAREEPDEEVKQVLQEVYKILEKDSDIVGMYYTAERKISHNEWEGEAEQMALIFVKEIAHKIITEAEEAAKKCLSP